MKRAERKYEEKKQQEFEQILKMKGEKDAAEASGAREEMKNKKIELSNEQRAKKEKKMDISELQKTEEHLARESEREIVKLQSKCGMSMFRWKLRSKPLKLQRRPRKIKRRKRRKKKKKRERKEGKGRASKERKGRSREEKEENVNARKEGTRCREEEEEGAIVCIFRKEKAQRRSWTAVQ